MNKRSKIYIHYNSAEYDPVRLRNGLAKRRRVRFDKPHGLWASPKNAGIGWKEWCEGEDFMVDRLSESFEFALKKGARVLRINRLEDSYRYLLPEIPGFYRLNLPKIYREFDAMEVMMSYDFDRLHDHNVFYGWDVDSICVWNPEIIIPVKREREV